MILNGFQYSSGILFSQMWDRVHLTFGKLSQNLKAVPFKGQFCFGSSINHNNLFMYAPVGQDIVQSPKYLSTIPYLQILTND
jgi:hypothetical protein